MEGMANEPRRMPPLGNMPGGTYAGAFSFAATVSPPRVGENQRVDLYLTPGSGESRDNGMFTNMHLRGAPKPKASVGQGGARADNMAQEAFQFKFGAKPTPPTIVNRKIGSAEPFDTDFDERLDNDSIGNGYQRTMHPLDVRAQHHRLRAENLRFIGGLDDD